MKMSLESVMSLKKKRVQQTFEETSQSSRSSTQVWSVQLYLLIACIARSVELTAGGFAALAAYLFSFVRGSEQPFGRIQPTS